MTLHKDFLGYELNVGDQVVFMIIGYRSLMKGTILTMSDKKARIEHAHQPDNIGLDISTQFCSQLIKIR